MRPFINIIKKFELAEETPSEIDPTEEDMYNFKEYLGIDDDKIEIKPVQNVSINTFIEQIKYELGDAWWNTPDQIERVEFIKNLIKSGKPLYPVIAQIISQSEPPWVREGHHRLRAMYELGIKTIPVIYVREITPDD